MPLRGRLAPTPTGFLHVGHARTFATAAARAGSAGLVLRIEDLDRPRSREEFCREALADLRWLGLDWTEGPDVGGPHGGGGERPRMPHVEESGGRRGESAAEGHGRRVP
ncbi:MAG: glutamate--tRNA ligase family protein, partial [Planctomycetia bacterium]